MIAAFLMPVRVRSHSRQVTGIALRESGHPLRDAHQPALGALGRRSAAVDGDLERLADLTHPVVAESAEAFDECADRDALD